MTEDMAEPLLPDRSKPDVLVPVKPAHEFTLAVVEVDDPQVLKTNQILKLPEDRIDRISCPEVVAGGEGMTGIEAEPDPLPCIDPLPDTGELYDLREDAILLSVGVLQKEHHIPFPFISERPVDGGDDPLLSRITPGPAVVSEVGHEVGYPEDIASLEFFREPCDRLFVDRIVGRCRVWEVGHVIDDRADAVCSHSHT